MIEDDDQGVAFLGGLPRTLTQKVEKYRLKADAEAHQSGIWDREKEGFVVNCHTSQVHRSDDPAAMNFLNRSRIPQRSGARLSALCEFWCSADG